MFYKKVEKVSETASLGFQEIATTTETTLDNEVLFTYANLDTTSTPYGNLFKSLRLPITDVETAGFLNLFNNTALSSLNTREIIVAEIPKGQYGELIDGKTFKMKFPVMLNGVASSTTVYGTYFGYNGKSGETITFNTGLNTDLCEKQPYVSDLGSAKSPNSNITFLYSNEIKKPIGSKSVEVALDQTTISLTGTYTQNNPYLFSVSASTNDIIFFEISQSGGRTESTVVSSIGVQIGSGFVSQDIKQNDVTVITTPSITNSAIRIFHTGFNSPTKSLIIKISKVAIGNLSWSQHTSSNKFPTTDTNESSGKRYAFFDGYSLAFGTKTLFVNSFDQPVGILYNDKGLAVITDSRLVSGFRYSAGTSSGYNGIASGTTYNGGDTNFAKIYFTAATLCEANYKSVTSEFVQNVMCIAMPNEFFYTNNSTYPNSYDESVSNKPVFITSVGLYNKRGELIGVGKLSEPVKKETSSIVPFNIKLKL